MTVIGVATAVAVMTSILAMGAGVRRFIDVTDQPDRAVILSAASPSEFAGAFTPADVAMIGSAPGVRRLPNGQPMVQPLAAAPVQLIRRADGVPGYAFLRGTGRVGDAMNKARCTSIAGRPYGIGLRELVVGREIHAPVPRRRSFGDHVLIHGAPWTVVGLYQDQGGIDEAGLAGDVETVRAAIGSPTYQSIGVMLQSASDFDRFRNAVMTNPQLNVQVERLSKYYHDQMGSLLTLFDFVGYFVGGVMAIGRDLRCADHALRRGRRQTTRDRDAAGDRLQRLRGAGLGAHRGAGAGASRRPDRAGDHGAGVRWQDGGDQRADLPIDGDTAAGADRRRDGGGDRPDRRRLPRQPRRRRLDRRRIPRELTPPTGHKL